MLFAFTLAIVPMICHSSHHCKIPDHDTATWIPGVLEVNVPGYWLLNSYHYIDGVYTFLFSPQTRRYWRQGCNEQRTPEQGRLYSRISIREDRVPFVLTHDIRMRLMIADGTMHPFPINLRKTEDLVDCGPHSKHTHFPRFIKDFKVCSCV